MQVVAEFDPTVIKANQYGQGGTFVTTNNGSNRIVVFNESNISLQFFFPNGMDAYIPAWQCRLFCMSLPNGNVVWAQKAILDSMNPPLSMVIVESYEPDEKIPETYPAVLSRQNNIGNSTPLSTQAQSLTNENSPTGSLVIDMGVLGNLQLITIYNDGECAWYVLQSGVSHEVIVVSKTGNALKLGQNGDTVEVLGNLQVDSGSIVAPSSSFIGLGSNAGARNILDSTTTDTYLKAATSVHMQVPNGTDIATATSAGWTLKSGVLGLISGTNSRWGSASFSGTGTINHQCGAQPDVCLPSTHVSGSQTVGYDSENSTTVHITTGAGLGGVCYSIKYS